jgi:16S rRNA (adenine1518-N6/adenine1519-N6)-dimethyltransferase
MNLSQVRAALAEACVRPVKTLGQNFLHDQNLARWIVDQARIEPKDYVVEIGPGLGALTQQILSRGARVLALEKDRRLVDALREKFADSQIEIRHVNALDFDPRALFAERNVKLLGNIPYYIASQLLLKFVDFPSCNSLELFMLQDEMARRIAADSDAPDYGALSLRLQLHHHVEYVRKIPAAVFYPRPDVASAVVRIIPRNEKDIGLSDIALFHKLVRLGFSQRRKQLRKLLIDRVPNWEMAARALGFSSTARAEELSREQWIALANLVAQQRSDTHQKKAEERFPVVDEHDRRLGTATRTEVHENNLRHRAVHVLLFNAEGDVLLQKRSARKDRHPLRWDSSAAGHVEADESYDQTATREVREELGIEAELHALGKLAASRATDLEFISVYQAAHNGPFRFPPEEISIVMFFPPALVDKWVATKPEEFAPGFIECWRLWQSRVSGDQRAPAEASATASTSRNNPGR